MLRYICAKKTLFFWLVAAGLLFSWGSSQAEEAKALSATDVNSPEEASVSTPKKEDKDKNKDKPAVNKQGQDEETGLKLSGPLPELLPGA